MHIGFYYLRVIMTYKRFERNGTEWKDMQIPQCRVNSRVWICKVELVIYEINICIKIISSIIIIILMELVGIKDSF